MLLRIPLLILALVTSSLLAATTLPHATPESQGVSSQSILNLIDTVESHPTNDLHSLIIVRHGKIVTEGYWTPFAADQEHELFSLSKSFTSIAIGLAIEEGLLTLESPVTDFFDEATHGELSDNQKLLRIRQLLTMDTGHLAKAEIFNPQNMQTPLVKQFFEHPIELKPGTHFVYNTAATYMLSAILQKITGQRVLEYLRPRLFDPLGMHTSRWDQCPEGIDFGGFGFHLRTQDIAKFGQLLLNGGKWDGKQLISEDWIAQATTRQVSSGCLPERDWDQGYGFQFWMNKVGGYRADGAFGQLCIVLPEYDMVIAMTASSPDMAAEMDWIWDHILPELSNTAQPEQEAIYERLQTKLADLEIKHSTGAQASPLANEFTGKTFRLEENALTFKSLQFDFNGKDSVVTIENNMDTRQYTVGYQKWIENSIVRNPMEGELASYNSGVWKNDHTYEMTTILEGKAPKMTLLFSFDENTVTVNFSSNMGMGPEEFPAFSGTAE